MVQCDCPLGGYDSQRVRCAHGGLVQPYCLVPAGLYCAPAGISVHLCDVNVMEGKHIQQPGLLQDAWQQWVGTPAVTGLRAMCAGEPDK